MAASTGGLYFSDHYGLSPATLEEYGAFDISVVSDLPLFIDPFLLFNSSNEKYQALHESIIEYLRFLKSKASADLDLGLLKAWYTFSEVKQNWFGFTLFSNDGRGLGPKFARALHESLGKVLTNFGEEELTRSSHLEKLALIQPGVGRDNISDFTTNLIKHFLCDYTQVFALEYMDQAACGETQVPRAAFNYNTESWETRKYFLPRLGDDFVLLTPFDLLTRDDTWISHSDMVHRFESLPQSVDDGEQRAKINNYFKRQLGKDPTAEDRARAVQKVIKAFPELIDLYIRQKEDAGDQARAVSEAKTKSTHEVLVAQVRSVIPDLEAKSDFYQKDWTSYDECLQRVHAFRQYVEHQDGYRLINKGKGLQPSKETDVQLFFGLIWTKTEFDVNREPNNGRGPVDFKVSYGSGDKSLIEFKLASNTSLRRNLEKQVAIYEKANKTRTSVKVIICYTAQDQARAKKILKDLDLESEPSIVLIDARADNKPSASSA
jgi:hypothetical protein